MTRRTQAVFLLTLFLFSAGGLLGCAQEQDGSDTANPDVQVGTTSSAEADVPFVETPQVVVDSMLALANVSEKDVVYDLGSGDGRIVITAAEKYGARGVGIEIRPELVKKARQNAREAGVEDQVEFRQGDFYEADISDATVVTMYLLPNVNLKLRSKLIEELSPGTRVVSHAFDMDEWEPDKKTVVDGNTIYLWTIPEGSPSFGEDGEG